MTFFFNPHNRHCDSLTYGFDGGSVSGTYNSSDLIIGGHEVKNQLFLAINNVNFPELSSAYDGIFGLGHGQQYFVSLKNQGLIDFIQFAFKFGRDGKSKSHITVGDSNPLLFIGKVTWSNALGPNTGWVISIDDFIVNNNIIGSKNVRAIIDSGNSYSHADDNIAKNIYMKIPNSKMINNMNIVRNNDQLNGLCAGGFQSGSPSGGWILGLTFLRNVYSIYELSQDGYGTKVGFATLSTNNE
ncbi:14478_t:CDS:2 [Gigaspora margarita]|uniref:14478_t:CDS:1 n=1 Tax=Gigaspora margarita TaxID=4874 RepID=A0ABN7WLT3_GIGMA|nr:14478_t:CDS:2 [Gigaspora margarita]